MSSVEGTGMTGSSGGLRRLLGPRVRARRLVTPAVHIVVLTSFAVAQPLFYLFGRNAEFFAVRGSTPSDIVIFTLGILLIPPAVLLAAEWLAAVVGERVWWVVHVFFVAGLAAVILLQAEKRLADSRGLSLVILACLAGAAAAFAYVRLATVRSFLTILLPAPFIFAALFLFNSPVTELLHVDKTPVKAASVDANIPVVFVMFDELGTAGLLNPDGRVNAERFPNFAALADDATFYRQATTVHAFTEHAVPSALTGKLPKQDELPIYANHRQNLFTLLGNGYRLRVHESLTHLCPVELCKPTNVEPRGERLSSLASDTGLVYLHVVLPDSMALSLPPVDQTWRDFAGMNVANAASRRAPKSVAACAPVCGAIRSMSGSKPRSLHYLHAQIPHIPWRYLPSGKHYVGDTRVIPGLNDRVWEDNPALVDAAYERYLLQVGYVDRALGVILRRLHETKLYDRALVVVMADHGVSFEPGKPRRDPTDGTLHDLAFVPLFIKLPEQKDGHVQDGFVRTIDVLPTIADVLGIDVPEPMDGRSLLHGEPKADGVVRLAGKSGKAFEAPLSTLLAERDAAVTRWTGLYGTGGWDELYLAGPRSELVGREIGDLDVGAAEGASVSLDGDALFADHDPEGTLSPVWVTGRLGGVDAGEDLAVAVNGSVVATGESYKTPGGEIRLAIFIPEESLLAGENAVEILAAGADGSLSRIAPAAPLFVLDGDTVKRAGGQALESAPTAIQGTVDARFSTDRYTFGGWAVDSERRKPVEAIAVFADGKLVYVARGRSFRTTEPERHNGVDNAAFAFNLPVSVLPEKGKDHEVRVFAISGDRVAELDRSPAFPWN